MCIQNKLFYLFAFPYYLLSNCHRINSSFHRWSLFFIEFNRDRFKNANLKSLWPVVRSQINKRDVDARHTRCSRHEWTWTERGSCRFPDWTSPNPFSDVFSPKYLLWLLLLLSSNVRHNINPSSSSSFLSLSHFLILSLSLSLSLYLSIYLSFYLSIYLSIHLSTFFMSMDMANLNK